MLANQEVVGRGRPLLIRPPDEINPQTIDDRRIVVHRLRDVVDAAPDQHPERPRIVAVRTADDPFGARGRVTIAGGPGRLDRPLNRDPPEGVGGRIRGMGAKRGVVAGIDFDHVEDVRHATGAVRR